MKRFRRSLLLGFLLSILMLMVLIMAKDHYEPKLHAAMKANDPVKVAEICLDWSESGKPRDFLYYFSMAWVHSTNGRPDRARYNLNKAASILRD